MSRDSVFADTLLGHFSWTKQGVQHILNRHFGRNKNKRWRFIKIWKRRARAITETLLAELTENVAEPQHNTVRWRSR